MIDILITGNKKALGVVKTMTDYTQVDSLSLKDLIALQNHTFSVNTTNPMNPSWGLMAEFEENPVNNGEIIFRGHTIKEVAEGQERAAIILVPPVKAQGVSPYSFAPYCRPHMTNWLLWGFHPEVVGQKMNLISFKEMRGALNSRSYVDFKMIR